MNRWLPAIIAAVVGVIVAALLLPSPDTDVAEVDLNASVTSAEIRRDNPLDFKDDQRAAKGDEPIDAHEPLKFGPGEIAKRVDFVPGPHPLKAMRMERLQLPDGKFYIKASSPWAVINRQLSLNFKEEPGAEDLIGTIQTINQELRQARRDPDGADFSVLEAKQKVVLDSLRSGPYFEDEITKISVSRIDDMFEEYYAQE